jgi:glyoxylase-like metal-dependent hydrolase (beta-lactamase superfamily II)
VKKSLFFVLSLAVSLVLPPRLDAVTADKPEFNKVADDVYVYVGKRNDANAMVVVTSQGVVVVDTGNNQPETRNILKHIRAITSQPVRYVVITQNHGDHIGGTPLFSPPAIVFLHQRVAKDWAEMKPHLVKAWRKRFPERQEALKNFHPLDAAVSFTDGMTLRLGGKSIELIYVDDPYNPGDIAVWLPQSGVLHGGFAAYKERHPDLRPDYSHGTTGGMLKQLEALIRLKPKVVVTSHGPIGDVTDLQVMVDYLQLARRRIHALMDKGMTLDAIKKEFHMNEYKNWDRQVHLPVTAATIYRELNGEGPEKPAQVAERRIRGKIVKVEEEGRFLTVVSDAGEQIPLRISNATDIEGIPDRSHLKAGMTLSALYEKQKERNETLEIIVEP